MNICTGRCTRPGASYSTSRWKFHGRVKCNRCDRAFSDDGQKYCMCCQGPVSRRKVKTPEKTAKAYAYLKEWTQATRQGRYVDG